MKNSIFTCFLFLSCLFFNACSTNDSSNNSNKIISVDIEKATEISFNKLVKSIKCIRLEENSKSQTAIWKVRIFGKYIYTYSLIDLNILIYSKTGEYLNTIDFKSRGKVGYPVDFFIKGNQLWVLNERSEIKCFSLDGDKYLGRIGLPFQAVAFIPYNEDTILTYDGNFASNIPGHIACFPLKSSIDKPISFILKNKNKKINCSIPPTLFTTDSKNSITYTKVPLNDTIYLSDPTNNIIFESKYHLDFHNKYLTLKQWPDNGFTDKAYAKIITSGKYIHNINSFYCASEKIFFHTKGSTNSYFSINTKTDKLLKFNSLFDNINTTTAATSIMGSSTNSLYFVFSLNELKAFYKTNQINPTYSEIEKIINCDTVQNQKIIVICTIK